MRRNFFVASTMASFVALTAVACTQDECPIGSVEFGGACVTLVGQDGGLSCGLGTEVVEGQCRPTADICGPNTDAVWQVDDDGVPTGELICVGKAGGDQPPECPAAVAGGTICVNGWAKYLVDPEDSSKMMTTLVTADSTLVEVRVYDPLAYAANSNVAPLAVAEANPVNGTFMISGIVVPPTGFIALVVVDAGDGAEFVFTGFPYPAVPGANLLEKPGYAITAAQNEAWSASIGAGLQSAGCTVERDTLYACGTWIGVFGFIEEGELTQLANVVPRNGGGAQPPEIPIAKAFYPNATWDAFSQPATSAENFTNETGAVLFPTASLSNFTGSCADLEPDSACETSGYNWSVRLGGAAPNAIFVQLMYPEGF